MTNQEAIDILIRHNAWRRDNETEFPELPDSPVLIGEAIDVAISALKSFKPLLRVAYSAGKNSCSCGECDYCIENGPNSFDSFCKQVPDFDDMILKKIFGTNK